MDQNITNCIQKASTESGNTVLLVQISESILEYICYLDIFRFIYIKTELIPIQKNPTQNPHINL